MADASSQRVLVKYPGRDGLFDVPLAELPGIIEDHPVATSSESFSVWMQDRERQTGAPEQIAHLKTFTAIPNADGQGRISNDPAWQRVTAGKLVSNGSILHIFIH